MEQSIDEFVRSTIVTASNSPGLELVAETRLVDINMDSLALASVIAQIEAVHELELEPEQVVRIFSSTTVGDVIGAVHEALSARA
jgi:acyl carrier protein